MGRSWWSDASLWRWRAREIRAVTRARQSRQRGERTHGAVQTTAYAIECFRIRSGVKQRPRSFAGNQPCRNVQRRVALQWHRCTRRNGQRDCRQKNGNSPRLASGRSSAASRPGRDRSTAFCLWHTARAQLRRHSHARDPLSLYLIALAPRGLCSGAALPCPGPQAASSGMPRRRN